MVLNNFLMILSGVLSGLDDFLTVSWECLMNNSGRSLLRAEWSITAKKLTSWLFGTLLVQIRTVGQGPDRADSGRHPGENALFSSQRGRAGSVLDMWRPLYKCITPTKYKICHNEIIMHIILSKIIKHIDTWEGMLKRKTQLLYFVLLFLTDVCLLDPCRNGQCVSYTDHYGAVTAICKCDKGWEGEACQDGNNYTLPPHYLQTQHVKYCI